MVETEVEKTLREIRERVRAEKGPAIERRVEGSFAPSTEAAPAADALARLEANLATTERAWGRLPPLLSYRRGWVARVELWVKRQIKRATHWYTWEQVNFNSAVHGALRDTLSALSIYEQHLAKMQGEIAALLKAETRLTSESSGLRSAIEQLRDEQQERVEHLLDEQRVCFKQLALENSENASASDRARRGIESRLDELAGRVEQLQRAVETELEELRRRNASRAS